MKKILLFLGLCITCYAQSFPVTPEQAAGMFGEARGRDYGMYTAYNELKNNSQFAPLVCKNAKDFKPDDLILIYIGTITCNTNNFEVPVLEHYYPNITANLKVSQPLLARFAPIRITIRPESIGALYPILRTKNIGVHAAQICNSSPNILIVPVEQVIGALTDFPYIPFDQAEILINQSYQHNPKLMIAKVGEYAALAATAVMAGGTAASIINISPKIISGAAFSIPLFHSITDKLKSEVPTISQFQSQALVGNITLQPAGQQGYCVSRLLFSSKIPANKLKSYDITVDIPY